MGTTLNTAVGMGAYALTDRATWIAFGNKGDFKVAVEGDERMFNQYGIILISPEKCPSVKADLGRSEEHTSELQVTNAHLVCRLLLEKKKNTTHKETKNTYTFNNNDLTI